MKMKPEPFMDDRDDLDERDSAIASMYSSGVISMETVGLRFGISRERVRQVLAEQGIEPRSRWAREVPEVTCARDGCDAKFTPANRAHQQKYCSADCRRHVRSAYMTHPRKKQIMARIQDGASDPEIALELGCSPNTVVRYRRELGVWRNPFKTRLRDRVLIDARADAMKMLAGKGLTPQQIGEIFGHDPRYIVQILKKV